MAKRTHSTIDSLPADLRGVITRMVTDAFWPPECGDEHEGRPTYDDIVEYIVLQGYSISRSALGRWAKNLIAIEVLRSRAEIVRNVMAEGGTAESFAEDQRVTADLINARIIEAALHGELTPKQTRELAAAARDCMRMRIEHDEYRKQLAEKVKDTADRTARKLKDAGMDRKKAQEIVDDVLGISR
ncbi:MAG: DUF3486 family protein [Planctomycetaceae bacterium]|nr:DUF3486 family protein [Planctomycetaceae bacterium]